VIWGYVFGASIASSAITYTRFYKTLAQRDALAATYGRDNAVRALFGPASRLQSVAGFTAFKISMTLTILGALWGLLTSTRVLRGEEDGGRWELLLAGQTTRIWATCQALLGLGAGVVTLWVLTAVITVVVGLDSTVHIAPSAALYFSVAMVASAVMFLAVGALTSQLAATRRQAAAYGATLLGLAYGVRLIADAGLGLHWLIWVSPLGWVEELRPLIAPSPFALVPIVGFTGVLCLAALRLAGSRDVGASVLPDRAHAEAHLGLLRGPMRLAMRLVRPTVLGWWVAIAISGLLYGSIAKSAGATISGSSVQQVFAKLGAPGQGADAVLGVCFLVVAVLIGFIGAGQLGAARSEEAEGRLDQLLVRPVGRASWIAGRLLVAVVVLVSSGVIAGSLAWLGAATQHTGLSFWSLLDAGVNLVPPAIAILGIGVLVFGVRPRLTSTVVYALLGWSLLVVIVGGVGSLSHWVLDTSVFHQMASAPAVAPNWRANAVMTAIGVAASIVGGFAFWRRDLQGE
jgi:ABC-2 type transport system permease protein